MFSVITDAWSSRIYKNDFSLALSCVDEEWVLCHVQLDSERFSTPHNDTTTSSMLTKPLIHCNLTSKPRPVSTGTEGDMCSAMEKVLDVLNIRSNTTSLITIFHVRCIAYVVNLTVGECLKKTHGNDSLLRSPHVSKTEYGP